MDALAKNIAAAYSAVAAAPGLFVAALVLVAIGVWKALSWAYSTKLANAQSAIELLERRLNQRSTDAALSISSNAKTHLELREAGRADVPSDDPLVDAAEFSADQTEVVGAVEYVAEGFTPDAAMDLINGKTQIQAEGSIHPYLGKRIVVQDVVIQVSAVGEQVAVALPLQEVKLVYCYFDPPNDDLAVLSIGDVIRVDGEITRIYSLGVELNKCRRLEPLIAE